MKVFAIVALVLGVLVASAAAAPLSEQQYEFLFTRFVEQYSKQYEVNEFFARYNTFKSNLDGILSHNAKNLSYTLAMNEFGDLSNTEFKSKMLGLNPLNNYYARSQNIGNVAPSFSNGDSLDWRVKGGVTPVKNQGQCGSCWAFSATGAIETAWFVKSSKLISLSDQQLVDCAGAYGNYGCRGGLMDSAFEWIIHNGGICSDADYPYTARDGTCKKTCTPVAKLTGYKNVPTLNEGALQNVVNQQTVSIAIQADQMAFQFYSGGVFDAACGTALNHGVLVAGYGSENGKDYWLVKNSWGTSWGESGYIRMIRNKNQCGLALQPVYPLA